MDHAAELNNPVPKKPLVFSKPETAILSDGATFQMPDFSENVHFEGELVLRIDQEGKNIEESAAWQHIDAITLGVDFTARDLQSRCKEKGHPWEIAKAFDGSAPLGTFIEVPESLKTSGLEFELRVNDNQVQLGHTKDLIFPIPTLLAYLSTFFTLRPGDLVFTGTPAGVGPVSPGDRFEGNILSPSGKQKLLEFETSL